MNTPAVTMVAAWMSADTGVGPSIASGSQVCSRNCADLPIAPMNSRKAASVSASTSMPKTWMVLPARPGTAAKTASKADRFGELKHEENAERETEVADAVDDERLDRRGVGRGLLIPEADEQIRGEADALPAKEHLHEIVGRHQHQHGESEQRQIGEEARPIRVLVHIADRIEMHEARNRRRRRRASPPSACRRESAQSIFSAPEVIQLASTGALACPWPSATSKKTIQDSAAATNSSPVVTSSEGRAPIRRPNAPAIRKPTRGRKTIA